jgi:hypothetical protein
MQKPPKWTLEQMSLRCLSYWQSVLRFGLPFIILYRGTDYASFRIISGNVGLRYPWRLAAAMDIPVMLLASAIWWGLMRQIAAWKRKNNGSNPAPSGASESRPDIGR